MAGPLVLDDNFVNGIDPRIWEIIKSPNWDATKPNGQKQFYLPDALSTDKNGLHISADHKKTHDPKTGLDLEYSSGRLETRKNFLYGKFEFTAQLPKGDGFWPALWMRNPETEGSKDEIDVIEGYGNHPSWILSTSHFWAGGVNHHHGVRLGIDFHNDPAVTRAIEAIGGKTPDFTADYHKFSVEWMPDHVTWFLDGIPYFTVSEDIPSSPMRLVLNLSVGGGFAGSVNSATQFPADFNVRSVKVWSK